MGMSTISNKQTSEPRKRLTKMRSIKVVNLDQSRSSLKHKKSGLTQKLIITDELSPNYMRPTSCSNAKRGYLKPKSGDGSTGTRSAKRLLSLKRSRKNYTTFSCDVKASISCDIPHYLGGGEEAKTQLTKSGSIKLKTRKSLKFPRRQWSSSRFNNASIFRTDNESPQEPPSIQVNDKEEGTKNQVGISVDATNRKPARALWKIPSLRNRRLLIKKLSIISSNKLRHSTPELNDTHQVEDSSAIKHSKPSRSIKAMEKLRDEHAQENMFLTQQRRAGMLIEPFKSVTQDTKIYCDSDHGRVEPTETVMGNVLEENSNGKEMLYQVATDDGNQEIVYNCKVDGSVGKVYLNKLVPAQHKKVAMLTQAFETFSKEIQEANKGFFYDICSKNITENEPKKSIIIDQDDPIKYDIGTPEVYYNNVEVSGINLHIHEMGSTKGCLVCHRHKFPNDDKEENKVNKLHQSRDFRVNINSCYVNESFSDGNKKTNMRHLIHQEGKIIPNKHAKKDDLNRKDSELQQNEAIKFVQEAVDEIKEPFDDQSIIPEDKSLQEVTGSYKAISQVIVCKKFIKALEKMKRKRSTQKRIHPKQQKENEMTNDELMLYFALQRVISNLGPTHKKKVSMLVQAFQRVAQ